MWLTFAVAVLACLAFLYVPGALFFRGLGMGPIRALVLAPVMSLFGYCILGILARLAGVACTWWGMFLAMLALCAVPLAWHMTRHRALADARARVTSGEWKTLALYLCVGAVVTAYVYCMPLETPDAFLLEYDNAFHLQTIRAFADSGSWSVLQAAKYLTPDDLALAPLGVTGFYPALWHVMCAMVMGFAQSTPMFAANCVNFCIAGIMFPTGMMLLLSTVFEDAKTVRLGSACVLAFLGFPWLLMIWGPLYANLFGFALVPAVSAVFIRIVRDLREHRFRALNACALLLGVFALVFAQTSAVFMCVVLLAPYCVYRLWTRPTKATLGGHAISGHVLAALFVVFVIVVWALLYNAPFLHELVSYNSWGVTCSVPEAMGYLVKLEFGWRAPQVVLGVMVIAGLVATLWRREYLWITVAYVLFGVIYVLCMATDGPLKYFLGGFWYTDSYRIVACLAITGVPLATLGLASCAHLIARYLRGNARRVVPGIALGVFCALVYMPAFSVGEFNAITGLSNVRHDYYNSSHHGAGSMYDGWEQAFVDEVVDLVGTEELVVNMPDDGSGYAYATGGLRTYYRDYRTYDGSRLARGEARPFETRESKLIRKYGAWVASNENVREAFERIGARYVMVLDYGETAREQPRVNTYDGALWTGLAAIRDDTPGFEVVLSEGDMRLYRIVS